MLRKRTYLSKVVVMWGRYRGDKHSHGYRDPSGSGRRDGTLSANVAQTVMGVEVGVMEGSRVHGCLGHLSIIHTAADQSLACIEHGGAHETASLTTRGTRIVSINQTFVKIGLRKSELTRKFEMQ